MLVSTPCRGVVYRVGCGGIAAAMHGIQYLQTCGSVGSNPCVSVTGY